MLHIHKKRVHAERGTAVGAVEEQVGIGVTSLASVVCPLLDAVCNGGWDGNEFTATWRTGSNGTGWQVFRNDLAVGGCDKRTEGEVFDLKFHRVCPIMKTCKHFSGCPINKKTTKLIQEKDTYAFI